MNHTTSRVYNRDQVSHGTINQTTLETLKLREKRADSRKGSRIPTRNHKFAELHPSGDSKYCKTCLQKPCKYWVKPLSNMRQCPGKPQLLPYVMLVQDISAQIGGGYCWISHANSHNVNSGIRNTGLLAWGVPFLYQHKQTCFGQPK